MGEPPTFSSQRLDWEDESLGSISLPKRMLELTRSFGSGLSRRSSDSSNVVWAVGDRGPNLKVETLLTRYGADHLAPQALLASAKVMPRLDVGPALAQLKIADDRVELVAVIGLTDAQGAAVSGLPMPGSAQ